MTWPLTSDRFEFSDGPYRLALTRATPTPRLDPSDAVRRLQRRVFPDSHLRAALGRWMRRQSLGASQHDDPTVLTQVLRDIRQGRLCVVELAVVSMPRYSHTIPDIPTHTTSPPKPIEEPAPLDLPTKLELRALESDGRPISNLGIELQADELHEGSTEQAGRHVFELITPGTFDLRITSIDDVPWLSDPYEGPSIEEQVDLERGDERQDVLLDLAGHPSSSVRVATHILNWLIVERPLLRVLVPDFLRFDHASALLVPAPWTDGRHPLAGVVRALVSLIDEPRRWLLVVGHASAPGGKGANQALSETRADALRALVEGDGEAWVEHARKRGSLRDVMAYLDYLGTKRGWSCSSSEPVAELGTDESEVSRASVSAFQSEYNERFSAEDELALAIDGVCGRKTLAALFEVLHDELERWLAKLGTTPSALPLDRVVYLGHGAALAGRGGEGDDPEAVDRILDLIIVENLPFTEEIEAAEVYESKVARWIPFEIPDEPDEWATGPFTIISDLTPEEPAEPETYTLESEDGSVAFQRVLPEDGELESGELILHFEALPTQHRYTLRVTASNGNVSVIFENLSYGELHGSSPKVG